ncbi:hypothetical protein BDN72DRAFT_891567 [Pluteus cervinus]|uniref:Uncharacterized protein n=1 Tax=Pluteus cervinus TaxID=181527 RepID=A0ACD3BFY2_9AGAR|nr:hypothetical protein BDN72DRAFT_891567 [Pluteus cervinus]
MVLHCGSQNRVDDIESFFHVLIYFASLYTKHDWGSSKKLTSFFEEYFQYSIEEDGIDAGGKHKIAFFRSEGADSFLPQIHNVPLRHTLEYLVHVLALRYPVPVKPNPFFEKSAGPSEQDQKLLNQLNTDSLWFSNFLTTALKSGDWDDPETGEMVPHKLPSLGHKPRDHYKLSISARAMKNQSASEQLYRLQKEQEIKEAKKLDHDGRTIKKRKVLVDST